MFEHILYQNRSEPGNGRLCHVREGGRHPTSDVLLYVRTGRRVLSKDEQADSCVHQQQHFQSVIFFFFFLQAFFEHCLVLPQGVRLHGHEYPGFESNPGFDYI